MGSGSSNSKLVLITVVITIIIIIIIIIILVLVMIMVLLIETLVIHIGPFLIIMMVASGALRRARRPAVRGRRRQGGLRAFRESIEVSIEGG